MNDWLVVRDHGHSVHSFTRYSSWKLWGDLYLSQDSVPRKACPANTNKDTFECHLIHPQSCFKIFLQVGVEWVSARISLAVATDTVNYYQFSKHKHSWRLILLIGFSVNNLTECQPSKCFPNSWVIFSEFSSLMRDMRLFLGAVYNTESRNSSKLHNTVGNRIWTLAF